MVPAMIRMTVIGSLSFDRNRVGARQVRKLGGTVTYAGLTAARRGIETLAVTSLAAADRGWLGRLEAGGLRIRCRIGAASTRFVNEIEGAGRVQRVEALAEPIRAVDLPDGDADVVLLGALHPGDIDDSVLERLERPGTSVACDLQGFVRRVENGRVRADASPRLARVLGLSRTLKADAAELAVAEAALGCGAAEMLERFAIEELIVTGADRGGRIHRRGGDAFGYDAAPARRVEDPTGAGDVFFAAYLAARLAGRQSPREAARQAATLATRQVEGGWLEAGLLEIDAPA